MIERPITDLFIPYTAFQYASAIRAIDSGSWNPKQVLIIHGFGSTLTLSGELYHEKFLDALAMKSIAHSVEIPSLNFFRFSAFFRSNFRLVTANPRRIECLILSRKTLEIILLDDGLGTLVSGGYFDKATEEVSFLKRLGISLGFIPSYDSILEKVAVHLTVFSRSIFPNPILIPYFPICSVPQENRNSNVTEIFISSLIQEHQVSRFVDWARCRFKISKETLLSAHPAMPADRVERICGALGISYLETNGILIEDYVLSLPRDGVMIFGQENTSTALLKELGFLNIDCAPFPNF